MHHILQLVNCTCNSLLFICAACSNHLLFSIVAHLFGKMLPALGGKHIFADRPIASDLKTTTFAETHCTAAPLHHCTATLLHRCASAPSCHCTIAPSHPCIKEPGPAECAERLNSARPVGLQCCVEKQQKRSSISRIRQ